MTPRPLSSRGAAVLRDVAGPTERDERGPKVAVRTLWSRLHADPEAVGVVFRALGDAAGISDVSGYLGRALEKRTAIERAELCRAAADALDPALEEAA